MHIVQPAKASLALTLGLLLVALLPLSACETAPPVQEMSDARQAIAVAREAGAEAHAKLELVQAVEFLQSAERELGAEQYSRAKRDAIQARSKALEARRLSEAYQPTP